jgi:hypothetical protein
VPDLAQQSDPPQADPSPALAEVRTLLERGRRGDVDALPALRRVLDEHPGIWRHVGDLAAHAERSWIRLAAGPDLVMQESLIRKLAELKAELAGPAPTPLERLLVDRVAATWLQVHYCDAAAVQAGEVSVRQAELALKRQDRAHRRYLTALAALTTIRRLLPSTEVPAVVAGEIGLSCGSTVDVASNTAGVATAESGSPDRGADPSLALVGAAPETRTGATRAARPRRRSAS